MLVAVARRGRVSRVARDARLAIVVCVAVPAVVAAQHDVRPTPTPTPAPASAPPPGLIGARAPTRLVLSGSVRDTGGIGIPYATVRWGAGSIVSNDSGKFEVRDALEGPTRFSVRRIGFQPVEFEMTISPDVAREVVVKMAPIPLALTTVNVEGDPDDMRAGRLTRVGFFDRRRNGRGVFLGPEEVEQRHAQLLSDVMVGIPGVTMFGRRGSSSLEYHSSQGCRMDVFLDGHQVSDIGDSLLNGSDIKAIEVYSNASSAPAQFVTWDQRKGYCGSIVVWTK